MNGVSKNVYSERLTLTRAMLYEGEKLARVSQTRMLVNDDLHTVDRLAKAFPCSRWRNDLQDNQFDGIAKGDIQKRSPSISHAACNTLGRMTEQCSQRYDCHSVHGKHNGRLGRPIQGSPIQTDANGYEDQKDVDPAVEYGILEMYEKAFTTSLDSLGPSRVLG